MDRGDFKTLDPEKIYREASVYQDKIGEILS
jgi:hypothetical protein